MYILINLKHNEPFIYRELHRHRIMETLKKGNTNMEIQIWKEYKS